MLPSMILAFFMDENSFFTLPSMIWAVFMDEILNTQYFSSNACMARKAGI